MRRLISFVLLVVALLHSAVVYEAALRRVPVTLTYPVPGNSGTITKASVTSTTLTLNWTKASDVETAEADLEYYGCRSASTITTVAGCLAATQLFDWTTDIATYNATGLTPLATVHFNVIVRDESGHTALYTDTSQAMPCGASKVVFTAQPASAALNASLGTVTVQVQNSSSTLCTDSTASIVLSKHGSATWGTLATGSSLTKSATAGVATWTDLSISTSAGSGSISAASSGLTGATSNSITISAGSATRARIILHK